LRMICSGVCLRRFIRVPFSPIIAGARNSHKDRTEPTGSGHELGARVLVLDLAEILEPHESEQASKRRVAVEALRLISAS
jgi:hypothetical protein